MIALAPRTVQNMPDCLSREPITVLHPASMTPEPTNKCWRRNLGERMHSALLSKYAVSMRNFSMTSGLVDASALARIDVGLLAKNEPRVCFRHRSRPCSSRLQEGHSAGFGASQAVREGTFGRCQLLFRSSERSTRLWRG